VAVGPRPHTGHDRAGRRTVERHRRSDLTRRRPSPASRHQPGVDVPRWIENDLAHATDPLEASYEQALTTATELMAYCRTLGVPLGINVESVSIRRVEIEASVRLAEQLQAHLH
jgi:hypothetical protein